MHAGGGCLPAGRPGRHAFVAAVRSAAYLTGLRELACSLARSNPGVPLIALGVAGDLAPAEVAEIEALAEYRTVEDIVQVKAAAAVHGGC
jgi:hypothetical protein